MKKPKAKKAPAKKAKKALAQRYVVQGEVRFRFTQTVTAVSEEDAEDQCQELDYVSLTDAADGLPNVEIEHVSLAGFGSGKEMAEGGK